MIKYLKIGLILMLWLFSINSFAVNPFVVSEIKIEGLQRVDPSTVINYLPIKVGDKADEEKIRDSIKSIFSSGLFADIAIREENTQLIIKVEERPFIAGITINGNIEFELDEIKKMLKEIGLSEGRVFDKAVLGKAEQELKRMYLSKSKYGVQITTISSPIEKNRVNIRLDINEGEIATIKQIRIIGNKKFTEAEILEQLSLSTPGWMSWLTRNSWYSKEKLTADIEQIKNLYLNNGYFEFTIESTQVTISPDRKDVFLTIIISEGTQFRVGQITPKFVSNKDNLSVNDKILLRSGEVFNALALNKSIADITEFLGNKGYAMSQVQAIPNIDYEKRLVSFDIMIDPAAKTYIRKINITGNLRTKDSVIRREVKQFEASVYDAQELKSSRDRIDRLGFFKDVNLDTSPVEGKPDQIDVTFTVTEKPTGSVNFGIGFNSTDKIGLSAGISQDNIFGTGNNLAFNINTSKSARTVSLSATDPFFTNSGISRSFDLYLKTDKLTENGHNKVDIQTRGLAVRFGLPVSDIDTIYVGAGGEYTGITTYAGYTPQRYLDLYNLIDGSTIYPLVTAAWARDNRDSAIAPTKGTYQRMGAELASGNEIAFAKIGYQYQTFKPISTNTTFAFNADLGLGKGLAGKDFPFFKNYFVGGIGSVRGYEGGSLGPQEVTGTVTDHVGGAKKIVFNNEFLFPMPGTGNSRTAKLFVFADAGYAWKESEKLSLSDLRYSYGVGFSWLSPIGPLKFSYAFPFKIQTNDKPQKFQFQIGTGF